MALSTKTFNTLVDALSSKPAANELVAIVNARAGSPSRILTQCLCDALIAKQVVGANGAVGVGVEVMQALVSGANLSLKACQRILIMMAGDSTSAGGPHAAGNELINFIQSAPQSKNTTL